MTEMRQSQRSFHQSPSSPSSWRRFQRIAALVFFSALGGIALLKAAQDLEQNWQQQLEMARMETEVRLAAQQLELAQAYLEDVRQGVEVGTVDRDSLAWAEFEASKIAQQLRMTQLNLEEMELSGRSPRQELYAPLVDGDDFVTRRLHIEMEVVQKKLELAQGMFEAARKRVESGVAPPEELASAENDVQHVRQEIREVAEKIRLRQHFLDGRLDPEQVVAESRLAGVEARVERLQRRVTAGQEEVERMRGRVRGGVAKRLDLQHAEYEMQRIRAELQLAQLELKLLRDHAR